MAIASRTATVVEHDATTATITGTLPTDRQAGDYVVVAVVQTCTVVQFTGPGGSWQILVSPFFSNDGNTTAVYGMFSPASAPTCTASVNGRASAICQAYSGVDTSTPVDVAAVTAVTSPYGSSLAVGPVTVATAGARLISGCVIDSSNATFTAAPAGMTMVGDASGGAVGRGLAVADEVRSATGTTGTRTWAQGGGSLGMGAYLVALRPASGALSGSVSDTATPTDTATGTAGRPRAVADTVSVSDASTRQPATHPRAATDTATPTDTLTRQATTPVRAVTDAVTPTDSATRASTRSRSLADAATLTDGLASTATRARGLPDTATPADAPTTTAGTTRAVADTLTPSDGVTRQSTAVRTPTDVVTPSDAVSASGGPTGAAADTVPLGDGITARVGWQRATADTATPTDAPVAAMGCARGASETVSLTDVLAQAATIWRALADSATVADSTAGASGHGRAVADEVAITDDASTGHGGTSAVGDAVPLGDSLTGQAHRSRAVADVVTLTDLATAGTAWAASLADAVAILDAVTRQAGHQRGPGDSIEVVDATSRASQQHARTIADTATPHDAPARQWAAARLAVDAIPITDGGVVGDTGRTVHRAVVDVIGPTDTVVGLYRSRPLTLRSLRVDSTRRRYVLDAPPVDEEGYDMSETYYRSGVEVRAVTLTDRTGATMTGLDFTAAVLDADTATADDAAWAAPDVLDATVPGIAVIGVSIGAGSTWDLPAGRWRVWVRASDGDLTVIRPERRSFELI